MQQHPYASPVITDTPFEQVIFATARSVQHATARARLAATQYLDGLERTLDQRDQDIMADFEREESLARAALNDQLSRAQADFAAADSQVRCQLTGVATDAPWAIAGWDDQVWAHYTPFVSSLYPLCARVGWLHLDSPSAPTFPALAGLVGSGHLFVQGDDPVRPAALELLRAVLLRLLVSSPSGGVHLVMADAYSAGASLAIFRRLPDWLRGAKIWVSPQEIEARLQETVARIESIVQTRLISSDATIEGYNLTRPEQRLPYQILALADFPAGFNDRMAELLLTIARNGPRAGVYIVAHFNPSCPLPRSFAIEPLIGLGTLLRFTAPDRAEWDDPLFGAYPVLPDLLPPSAQVDALLSAVSDEAERSMPDLSYTKIAVAPEDRWQGSTLDGLEVAIGVDSTGEPHYLRLGQDPGVVHHGLVGGASGSGKGNLLHVLITQLALRYGPDELGLYLLDFKEGVEFQRYVSLPQARAVGLESEREFGLNVLRRLQAEMEDRGRLFKSAGGGISKFADYRRQTSNALPRLLLVVDEFQVLFREEDGVAREAAQLLEDLAKRGRSAAIHVLLCSQSPSTGSYLLTRVYDQMGLRIALQCRQRDALAILGEGNDAAAHLERVGEAIYNDRMGDRDKNHAIRVAHLSDQEWRFALDTVGKVAGEISWPPPFTFDGHSPASLSANAALKALLAAPEWSQAGESSSAWLGEPVDLKPPTEAGFERYPRANLLIAGDNEVQARGLLLAILLGLAVQRSPQDIAFFLIDPVRPSASQPGLAALLAPQDDRPSLPHPLTVAGPREASGMLATLLATLKERLATDGSTGPDYYVFVAGMHRWRDLRGPDSITQSEAAKGLMKLADEGPEVGIHLVAWADSLGIVEQAFKRGGQRHFDLRVALRLSSRDSGELLGGGAAASLEENRALFRHEDWELGRREKFKPYVAPEPLELARIVATLAARSTRSGES